MNAEDKQEQNAEPVAKQASEHYDWRKMVEAARDSNGTWTHAAHLFGCRRETIKRYADHHVEIMEAMKQAKQRKIDYAENTLFAAMAERRRSIVSDENGNEVEVLVPTREATVATMFYLKCHGKSRGYVERGEFDIHRSDEPVTVIIKKI